VHKHGPLLLRLQVVLARLRRGAAPQRALRRFRPAARAAALPLWRAARNVLVMTALVQRMPPLLQSSLLQVSIRLRPLSRVKSGRALPTGP
jgi:hypothetical protein